MARSFDFKKKLLTKIVFFFGLAVIVSVLIFTYISTSSTKSRADEWYDVTLVVEEETAADESTDTAIDQADSKLEAAQEAQQEVREMQETISEQVNAMKEVHDLIEQIKNNWP